MTREEEECSLSVWPLKEFFLYVGGTESRNSLDNNLGDATVHCMTMRTYLKLCSPSTAAAAVRLHCRRHRSGGPVIGASEVTTGMASA